MPVALAALAHPDDAEFLCAGTLLRLHRELGWDVHVATMTPGDCGSVERPPEEIARVRRAEGHAAAAALGGKYHCLEERDLRVVYGEAAVEKAVRLINEVRADLVFTHSPDDYHLDHEQTSKIVRAATFAAPIPNFLFGRHSHPPLDHIPYLYYCDPLEGKDAFGRPIPAGFLVDITGVMDEKAAALTCHASQRNWLAKHHGVDNYIASMTNWAAVQGKRAGVPFAEGFRQHLGHSYPQDNILAALFAGY
ncbi:MAG TPA: PIG-L deacetylase family protein [Fimbriiglobus sp.]|jgi:LmbE family N-acetylglucosaminyl deacetylase